jgi:hypothetical protein
MNNYDNYLFRCSALGNIVTKSGKITDGFLTYVTECWIGEKWGVTKEAYGKALEKGIAVEEDIIQLINDCIYRGQFVAKVRESKSNQYIKGTADIDHAGIIHDAKAAYDRFTFGKAKLTHLYEWQLKGYMWLYGRDRARLCYGLVNMPFHMIQAEQRSLFYKNPGKWLTMESDDYIKACDQLEAAHNYDHIDIYERLKLWELEYSEQDTEKIKDWVSIARSVMNSLERERSEQIEYLKSIAL